MRKDEDFFLILDSLLPTGTYHRYFSILFSDRRKDRNYVTAPGKQLFTLHITRLDTTERIFSGAFSGTLFYKKRDTLDAPVDLTDSLVIEDGRFDIRLR